MSRLVVHAYLHRDAEPPRGFLMMSLGELVEERDATERALRRVLSPSTRRELADQLRSIGELIAAKRGVQRDELKSRRSSPRRPSGDANADPWHGGNAIAYRGGYMIKKNGLDQIWVEKDGHLISWASNIAGAKKVIDGLLAADAGGPKFKRGDRVRVKSWSGSKSGNEGVVSWAPSPELFGRDPNRATAYTIKMAGGGTMYRPEEDLEAV